MANVNLKINRANFRRFERSMIKQLNKSSQNIQKKVKPITIPCCVDENYFEPNVVSPVVNNYHVSDGSVVVNGDINGDPKIATSNSKNISLDKGLANEMVEYVQSMSPADQEKLKLILSSNSIRETDKSFFDRHPKLYKILLTFINQATKTGTNFALNSLLDVIFATNPN